jgi:tartronate-semialdehyde synthase
MIVSEAIVKILEMEGITDAFGIPGAGINGLYKFMASSSIKHYTHRHEECAVHAAGGTMCSGVGSRAVHAGPRHQLCHGYLYCNIDSIPVIAITGQAVTAQLGKDAFQCVDIAAIAAPVAKKTWCVTNKEDVVSVFQEAFKVAREGKPGPVVIDLPLDVQNAEIDFDPATYQSLPYDNPAPKAEEINQAMEMLKAAKHPVIIMGARCGRALRGLVVLLKC